MIVVKVGGSLFDHPMLGPGLRRYVGGLLESGPVCLMPGGGAAADVVRDWDRTHQLGEETAHWVAVESLDLSAAFLQSLFLGEAIRYCTAEFLPNCVGIVTPWHVLLDDRGRPGALPASWSVTSDSIAARIATLSGATHLILLKSLDIPAGTPWPVAAARGWVDAHFPTAVADAPFAIEAINFRSYLDSFTPPR